MLLRKSAASVLLAGLLCAPSAADETVLETRSSSQSPAELSSDAVDQVEIATVTFSRPVIFSGSVQTIQQGQTEMLVGEGREKAAFLWESSGDPSQVELKANVPYFVLHTNEDYVWLGGYRGIYVLPQKFIRELGQVVTLGGYNEYE